MKKTVTREEVEKALFNEFKGDYHKSCVNILNYLFGEPYEPKEGDWVVGWHHENNYYSNKAWQIDSINGKYVYTKNNPSHSTGVEDVRPATEEEIKRAQWKEGEVYEVWDDDGVVSTAFSSANYGLFNSYKGQEGRYQWDNFKRIVQC